MNSVLDIVCPPAKVAIAPSIEEKSESKAQSTEAVPQTSFSSQSISVRVGSVLVTLLNDLIPYSTPLVRFNIADLAFRMHAWGHSRSLIVSLGFEAGFYNNKNLCWEPMIEPFTVSATVDQASHTHAQSCLHTTLFAGYSPCSLHSFSITGLPSGSCSCDIQWIRTCCRRGVRFESSSSDNDKRAGY
jgi:hypothetical protein